MHWGILLLRRLLLLHLPFLADRPAALPVSLPLLLRFPHPSRLQALCGSPRGHWQCSRPTRSSSPCRISC